MNKLLRIIADHDFESITLNRIAIDIDVSDVTIYIVFNGGYYVQMNITHHQIDSSPEEALIKDFKQMFEAEFEALKVRTKSFKDTNV